MTQQYDLPERDDETFFLLLKLLKQITSSDADLTLADLADLVDSDKVIGMDEFGRVGQLSADGKASVYKLLKHHAVMLANFENEGPGFDIYQWHKYQDDLKRLDYCPQADGMPHLSLRVWIDKKHLDIPRLGQKKNAIMSDRVAVIHEYVKKHGDEGLIAAGKINAWNLILSVIDHVLFPPVATLGQNDRVSKTFAAAGIHFKSGRPSKK